MANHWLVIRPIKHDPSTTRFGPDRAWGGTARCTRGLMCGRIAGRSLTNGGSSLPSTHAASRRGGNVFCRVNGWCSFLGHMIKTFVCKIVSVVMILKLETLCNKLTAVHHWYKLSRWRILFGGILYIVIRTCVCNWKIIMFYLCSRIRYIVLTFSPKKNSTCELW